MAFHIKLIEYTAARKPVIATPLAEVARLSLPNVICCNNNMDEWNQALDKARRMVWQAEWDELINRYDWKKISDKYAELIEG